MLYTLSLYNVIYQLYFNKNNLLNKIMEKMLIIQIKLKKPVITSKALYLAAIYGPLALWGISVIAQCKKWCLKQHNRSVACVKEDKDIHLMEGRGSKCDTEWLKYRKERENV